MSTPADDRFRTAGEVPTSTRYVVLAWLCLSATIAYVQRNSLGVAESTIRAELSLSEHEMGLAMSAFFATYAIFQLPTGWLAHMGGTRRVLSSLTVLWSLATGGLAFCQGVASLAFARGAMGAAQAGVFPCATDTIARWMPPTRRGISSGVLTAFMSVGGAGGAMLTGYLLGQIGWRNVYLLFALPGLMWAGWFWWWFRDSPEMHAAVNDAELGLISPGMIRGRNAQQARPREPTPWGVIFRSRAMWALCGQQFFRAAGYIFFASWFPTYLQQTRGVSIAASGLMSSLPLLTFVLGSVVGGAATDALVQWSGSRRVGRQGLAVVSMLGCVAAVLAAYPINHAWLAVVVISAGSGCAALAGPCSYSMTIDLGGRHVPTVFSVMNMAGNVGAVLFPLVVPYLIAFPGGWDWVLFLFAAIHLAAGICWVLFDADRPLLEMG